MLRWFKRIAITLLVVGAIGAVFAWWAYQKTKEVPEFYARAVESIPEDTKEAVKHVEREVEELQKNVTRPGSWHAVFSAGEINAWLKQELPKKFPKLLRQGVQDPRLMIEEGRLLIAARYKDSRIDTVVSFQIAPKLTELPNVLALHVSDLRAGALPLPLDQFLQKISKETAKGDVDVKWEMTDDGPVARISVPSEHPNYVVSPVIVESIILRDGEIEVEGHSGPDAHESFHQRLNSNSHIAESQSKESATVVR